MPVSKDSNYVIGLTGGIGSGKTLCSDHFHTLGAPIIDTDVIAREVVEPGKPTLEKLSTTFGDQILLSDGSLDRAKLRDIAFSSESNKSKLDNITHPAIRHATRLQIAEVNYPYCIVVIPLLTSESSFSQLLDRVLVVTADQETKVERVKKRSQLSRDDVVRIMKTQLDDRDRLRFADDIINNNSSIKQAHLAVEKLHQNYLELASTATHIDQGN